MSTPVLSIGLDDATITALAEAVAAKLLAAMPTQAPAPEPATSDALNERAAAELAGVSVGCLRGWRLRRTNGPSWRKLGGRVVYSRKQILAWLDSKTVSA